jgi:hypothetical protein
MKRRFSKNQLSEEEVSRRLQSYHSKPITDELYQFGEFLLREVVERFDFLDKKANTIAGYSGGIAALVVSTFDIWRKALSEWAVPIMFLAALAALVAAGFGLSSVALAQVDWFSPREWFHEDCLEDAERMRKYRILTMYTIRQNHLAVVNAKADRVQWATSALWIAGGLLLLALLDAFGSWTITQWAAPLFHWFRIRCGQRL